MRLLFSGLVLAVIFASCVHIREIAAKAQVTGTESTPEAQSPEKNQQEADENDAYRKSTAVVALGSKLGLNANQSATAFQVLNFVLLAIGAGWALGKILPAAIRNRNTAIQKGLTEARAATEDARVRLKSVEERLSKLDAEIAAMRSHAEQDAAKEEQRVKVAVEEEKKKILATAEQEIAAATIHAQKQLQQHAAELAVEQAARKLVVSAETDRLLVQGFAQRLTGNSKKGQN
jgi:F-type H+-transporting ATPase subunit b